MRSLGIAFAGAVTLLSQSVLAVAAEGAAAQAPQRAPVSPENLAAATRHFDDATQFYRAGKYDEARIEFEACLALTHDAELLHNLSLTAEKQGKLSDAIDFEERFLEAKPQGVTQRDADEARGRIARLREQLATPSNAPRPVLVPERPAAAATDRRRIAPAAVGLIALGGVSVVVGIGCGAGSWATARMFDMPLTVSEHDALTSRGQALDRAGIALDVIGGVSLTAGLVWALVDRSRIHRPSSALAWTQNAFARVP